MKPLFLLLATCFCLFACKKEVNTNRTNENYLAQVKTALRNTLDDALYADLDFSGVVLSKVDSVNLYVVNIPLLHGPGSFLLVETDPYGHVLQGRIVSLQRQQQHAIVQAYNGNITIRSLQNEVILQSAVQDGHIIALQQRQRTDVQRQTSLVQPVQASGEWLPEVIVVGFQEPSGNISYGEWISLQFLFSGGSGFSNNYYSPVSSDDDQSVGHGGGGGVSQVPPVEIEKESIYNTPMIDINKIFKCFDYVPSTGAIYKLKLCADLPSNNSPNASTTYSSVSAGHTFLIVTKANAGISVTQSFGFYPQSTPSIFNPFSAVPAAIRDNGAQEINASIEMNISQTQFNVMKQNAITASSRQYSLGDYNCTNYALGVFNSIRTNPIVVPPYRVILPNNLNTYDLAADPIAVDIEESPQMLFSKLRDLKNSNSVEAPNILIDQSHNSRAPISKGQCD